MMNNAHHRVNADANRGGSVVRGLMIDEVTKISEAPLDDGAARVRVVAESLSGARLCRILSMYVFALE